MIDVELKVTLSKSQAYHREALGYSPGGAPDAKAWSGDFFYVERAHGCRLRDLDGNDYIDYHAAAGPIILGHSDAELNEAIIDTVKNRGIQLAQPHVLEMELARKLQQIIPNADLVAFGNAGTDTLQFAIRMARAYTGRPKVVKFGGGYRGWTDGPGGASKAQPGRRPPPAKSLAETAGVLPAVLENNLELPYNDLDAASELLERERQQISCVVVEPIIHGYAILPKPGYLEGLRDLCTSCDIPLVLDEIITGFRHDLGGLQRRWGIDSDIAIYSKAMANGYAISAITAKREYMSAIPPDSPAFLTGTYNGNPLSTAAALKTIEILGRPGFYERLYRLGDMLRDGVNAYVGRLGLNAICYGYGSTWGLYFDRTPPSNHHDVRQYYNLGGRQKHTAYARHLLNNGIFLHPARPTRCYIYAAHTEEDIQQTIDATASFLEEHQASLR